MTPYMKSPAQRSYFLSTLLMRSNICAKTVHGLFIICKAYSVPKSGSAIRKFRLRVQLSCFQLLRLEPNPMIWPLFLNFWISPEYNVFVPTFPNALTAYFQSITSINLVYIYLPIYWYHRETQGCLYEGFQEKDMCPYLGHCLWRRIVDTS